LIILGEPVISYDLVNSARVEKSNRRVSDCEELVIICKNSSRWGWF